MKKAVLVIVMFLVGCGTASSGDVNFTTISHETYAAGITGRINEVITDPISFESFWKSIYRGTEPIPDVPKVDFTKDMVIAVSPGEMPTGGYDAEIVKVQDKDTKLEVTILVTRPSGGAVTESLTEPHHIIKLPKKSVPVVYKWVER